MTNLNIENDVLIGIDNELFLASEQRKTIDVISGRLIPNEKSIERLKNNLSSRKFFF